MEKLNLKRLFEYEKKELPKELAIRLSYQQTNETGYKPQTSVCPKCGSMDIIMYNQENLVFRCMSCECKFDVHDVEIV